MQIHVLQDTSSRKNTGTFYCMTKVSNSNNLGVISNHSEHMDLCEMLIYIKSALHHL